MSDFLQRHIKAVLLGAAVLYFLSLGVWFIWTGVFLYGAAYGSFVVIVFAGLVAILYPVIIIGSLAAGWQFQNRNQAGKALAAALLPLLYIPIMVIVEFVTLRVVM
jgi:hypothetical protein